MAVGIQTIVLKNETIPTIIMREGIHVSGKQHKLIVLQKGSKAHVQTKLYKNTVNPGSTIKNTKWIFGTQEKDGSWEWASWSNGDKIPLEIADHEVEDYATSSTVKIGSASNIGRPYWLEAFIHHPEMPDAVRPKGVYAVIVDKPQIIKAVFTKINHLRRTEDEVGEQQVFEYGEVLRIELHTHGLNKRDEIKFECSIDGEMVNYGRRHTVFVDDLKYNGIITHDVYIDPKWKEELGHGKNEVKNIFVKFDVMAHETIERNKQKATELGNTIRQQFD